MVQESTKNEKDSDPEVRKWSKPIMEKRRRERINRSLDELKRLVLEAQNRDCSRYTKLEKADILEMTVRHLRDLRRHHRNVQSASEQHMLLKYRAGYNACLAEVSKYMMGDSCSNPLLKTQIFSHLAGHHRTAGLAEDFSDPRTATAFPYVASSELSGEEQRMLLHRDATETRFSTNRNMSPYMVQTQRMLPSTGSIPVHYVPVLTHEPGTPPGLHALVPGGPSPGLQLRDPLWRPW